MAVNVRYVRMFRFRGWHLCSDTAGGRKPVIPGEGAVFFSIFLLSLRNLKPDSYESDVRKLIEDASHLALVRERRF